MAARWRLWREARPLLPSYGVKAAAWCALLFFLRVALDWFRFLVVGFVCLWVLRFCSALWPPRLVAARALRLALACLFLDAALRDNAVSVFTLGLQVLGTHCGDRRRCPRRGPARGGLEAVHAS